MASRRRRRAADRGQCRPGSAEDQSRQTSGKASLAFFAREVECPAEGNAARRRAGQATDGMTAIVRKCRPGNVEAPPIRLNPVAMRTPFMTEAGRRIG